MSSNQPNVIWVFADQLRAQALGYAGDPNATTPRIDGLARRGFVCGAAVSGAPWCTPFRAALLTGRYPHQVGCTRTPSALDPAHRTAAHHFNKAGYHTLYVGKWHLDGSNENHPIPPERRGGFREWVGYENRNDQYRCEVAGTDVESGMRIEGYETDGLTRLFLDRLDRHQRRSGSEPFFAVLSVQPPHDPYVAPPELAARYRPEEIEFRPNVPDVPWVRESAAVDLAGYYAMIENLDQNLGRIEEALRQWNLLHNTVVVFFSDHGDSHGSHGMYRKSNPYEESIRIPLVFAGPGVRRGAGDAIFTHVDYLPTTMGLCGLDSPEELAGVDHSAWLRDGEDIGLPDAAYLQQCRPKPFPYGIDVTWRGVVTRDGWKYVCTPGQRWLMFNLNDDPYEQANLAFNTKFTSRRLALHERLCRFVRETGDDFDLPAPVTLPA